MFEHRILVAIVGKSNVMIHTVPTSGYRNPAPTLARTSRIGSIKPAKIEQMASCFLNTVDFIYLCKQYCTGLSTDVLFSQKIIERAYENNKPRARKIFGEKKNRTSVNRL